MALQGTIDTFPLGDVLTLLASSAKSGRLVLNGDRGSGLLWVDSGNLLGGEINGTSQLDTSRLIFELLRFAEGAFEFHTVDPSELPSSEAPVCTLDASITDATAMMEEWRKIEAVVPSTLHGVKLVPVLPQGELVVDQELWGIVVAVSMASSVADVAGLLDMDSYEASAVVAGLVAQQLVEIVEPLPDARSEFAGGLIAEQGSADDVSESVEASVDSVGEMWSEHTEDFPEHFPIDDLVGDGADEDDLWSSPAMAQLEAQRRADAASAGEISLRQSGDDEVAADLSGGPATFDASDPRTWDDTPVDPVRSNSNGSSVDETADEVLRQMSKLSPKAAEAIAAALGSGLADAGDEPTEPDSADGAPLGPVSFLDSF